jgi:hypothetical protein
MKNCSTPFKVLGGFIDENWGLDFSPCKAKPDVNHNKINLITFKYN